MHHYVYCVENLLNGKIYVGKHSTENLDDGYMGSGKLVTRAISKYGLGNFRKFVIAELETEEKAYEFEKLLVTEEFVSDENTYNMKFGGLGFISGDPQTSIAARLGSIAQKKNSKYMKSNKEHFLRCLADGRITRCDWRGRRHNDETKRKIGAANSLHQQGEKNSQFGTCWVSHPEQKKSQRVNKGEVEGYLADGWVKGRKMKW